MLNVFIQILDDQYFCLNVNAFTNFFKYLPFFQVSHSAIVEWFDNNQNNFKNHNNQKHNHYHTNCKYPNNKKIHDNHNYYKNHNIPKNYNNHKNQSYHYNHFTAVPDIGICRSCLI
jgi:hypothetical protein